MLQLNGFCCKRITFVRSNELQPTSVAALPTVLQHPKYIEAKSVSVYLSFDKEIDTNALVRDIFKTGKICYIPRFKKGFKEMEMVQLYSLEDYGNLPVNKFNIKQPADDEQRPSVFDAGTLDVILNPGLAFTKDGKRLGRGKGYYDKFLGKCARELNTRPTTLALAFKEQIVSDIPTTDTDIMMDYVLYEDGRVE
ncbi:5-formyltetrahydrofolate cyclo-ligase isoform X2 [Bacillus rossius redtenbacheri]|uniref:5-formyltetrahydrofolate cyclo-ligase isoform X2 n=1 Tax=Bacillus rossius redtenbacheri TaxID=93214 RepID=UPI002FDC9316